ncbi:MAG: substrate-binding domain-containing protein [Microthrixaceae bacterium]
MFATNELVLATRPGNPEGIRSLGDLGEVGVVALCAEVAPCGRYAQELLGSAGVRLDESRVTRGQNATATLTALTEGDADAAILYRSDAVRAGDRLELVTIPEGLGPLARYPAAVLRDGDGSAADGAARDFLTHRRSGRSARVLAEAGFGTP